MPQRFIRKNPSTKRVGPARRTAKLNFTNINTVAASKPEAKENKVVNEVTDMNTNNNIEQLKAIVGNDTVIPKRKVKIEKKDKGLIERTEDSTILITEDNKMMLND